MYTYKIPVNLTLCDLVGSNYESFKVEHLMPDQPHSNREATLLLAGSLMNQGETVGMEVKIPGVRRSLRAPLVRIKPNVVEIIKVVTDVDRLENALFVVNDLVTMAKTQQDCIIPNVVGVVVFEGQALSPRVEQVSRELGINIVAPTAL